MNLKEQETKSPPAGDSSGGRGKGLTRRDFLKRAGAAALGAAAGAVLPDLGKGARADAPVVEAPPPDAPVEPVYTNRVLLPNITREYKTPEPPLYLREFGAPERGVIMRNKVEQGGGNLAHIEMGDQELFENMMYLRETYGRPDLRLEINFYSSRDLLLRDPQAPRWIQENYRGVLNYDVWSEGNGTFENGSVLFRYTEEDKTLRFYAVLPEPKRGKTPTESEVNLLHVYFLGHFTYSVFLAKEDGRSNLSMEQLNNRSIQQDFKNHPYYLLEFPVRGSRVVSAAAWIKMETIPTTGGK